MVRREARETATIFQPGFGKEQESARKLVDCGLYNSITNFDRKEFVDDVRRSLVVAIVDAPKLYNKTGASYHFVVVYGTSSAGQSYFFHDPGIPPRPAERVEADVFWKSFTSEIILVPHGAYPSALRSMPMILAIVDQVVNSNNATGTRADSARGIEKAVRRLRRRRLPANNMHGPPIPYRGARPCEELTVKSR